jgi:predicted Holliday junction resolvase-like endonuclease
MEVLCTQLNLQTLIVIGVILILVLVFEINLFKSFKRWLEYKYAELEQKQYDIDTHLNVSDDIETRLDTVIESCFQEYSLMNLIYKTDWYITEKEEIQISKDICSLVSDRVSPVMLKQLALYYNEDAIYDIIAKRVYFKVTNFVIEHNKVTPIAS